MRLFQSGFNSALDSSPHFVDWQPANFCSVVKPSFDCVLANPPPRDKGAHAKRCSIELGIPTPGLTRRDIACRAGKRRLTIGALSLASLTNRGARAVLRFPRFDSRE